MEGLAKGKEIPAESMELQQVQAEHQQVIDSVASTTLATFSPNSAREVLEMSRERLRLLSAQFESGTLTTTWAQAVHEQQTVEVAVQPIVIAGDREEAVQRGGENQKKRKHEQQIDGSQIKGKRRIGIEVGDGVKKEKKKKNTVRRSTKEMEPQKELTSLTLGRPSPALP